MAARRKRASGNEDLSTRCISSFDEVKDLIEASDREAHPLSFLEANTGVSFRAPCSAVRQGPQQRRNHTPFTR